MSFLDELNEHQQQAVIHESGPLLILAGAGSGKTRALTYRAAYLIREQAVAPEQILLTTFTNKAALEMQERLQHLAGLRLPFAGTFHSLCARLLRIHGDALGIGNDFVIYDTKDQLDTIKTILKELKIDPRDVRPGAALHLIGQAKNELIDPIEYEGYARGSFQKQVAKIYSLYQKKLAQYHAVDFDDLLLNTVNLLQKVESIRRRYQEQFLHVLIDEYQDTNKAQYQLSKLLSAKHRNICVVGDASQAIYSWRGADYRNLQLLKQDFPDLTTIKLERNYRSTNNILTAAYGVIAHNTMHPILELWTDADEGQSLTIHEARNEYQEVEFVVDTILANNLAYNETAVLYRTNAQSRVIEEVFLRRGIPYVLVGGVKFYERKEVKDVLSYARYAFNRNDMVSYERITKLGKRRLRQFQQWLETADLEQSPLVILEAILQVTGYLDSFDRKNQEDLARIENVQELRSVADSFESLGEFLENVALVEQDTKQKGLITTKTAIAEKNFDAVVLMTLHASKGLEFDTVFMIGMEEGLFPHSRSVIDKSALEEERRLCYVGMTRAKQRLYATHAAQRLYFGNRSYNPVSRFIEEIPPEVVANNSKKPARLSEIDEQALEQFLNDEIDIDDFLNS